MYVCMYVCYNRLYVGLLLHQSINQSEIISIAKITFIMYNACIKHVWYLQPNIQHARGVYSHAIGVNTSCKLGTLWLAGCSWLSQAAAGKLLACRCEHHTCGNLNMVVFGVLKNCDRLIEEIRKYELLWKWDHKDYGKHGPRLVAWKKIASTLERIQFSLHESH